MQDLQQKIEKRKRKLKKKSAEEAEKIQANALDSEINANKEQNEETQKHETIEDDLANVAAEYKILGGDTANDKKEKVDAVLPSWLAYPTIIDTNIDLKTHDSESLSENISSLNYLKPHIQQSLKDLGIKTLFPVQKVVIPYILQAHKMPFPFRPRDICVSSPTGSGKTLAFAVPIVQLLADRVERKIQALIVLPVAELAHQIFKVFKKLCSKTELVVCFLSKQYPFALEQKKLVDCWKGKLYSKVDIVITTPGRLVEHMHSTKGFCLKSLKFIVIDEADRIMDAIHHNWLYHLDNHVKATTDMLFQGRSQPLCLLELYRSAATQPHKLLFSATLSQDPEKLQNLRLFQPKLFTSVLTNPDGVQQKLLASQEVRGEFIGKYTTPAELTEKYCLTESKLKPLTLYSLIKENCWTKFLCFTNTAESSNR